jgi:hypothetical protein
MLKKTASLLKALNILNWTFAVVFLAMFGLTLLFGDKFLHALEQRFSGDTAQLMLQSSQWIFLLTLPVVYAAHRIFSAMRTIVISAIDGDPFIPSNAALLRIVGWALLAIQILDLASGIIMVRLSEATGEYWGWSPALTGWLAALLMFLLASIFDRGAAMRDELEGTV